VRASVDWLPKMTRSNSSPSSALAITRAVPSASEPAIASSVICRPGVQPVGQRLAHDRLRRLRAHQQHLDLGAGFSLSRTASSIANSLTGHSTDSTDSRSTVLSFGSIFFSPAVSGTRLTGTMTFIRSPSPRVGDADGRGAGRAVALDLPTMEL
jgi:hypothetical protein